ncbi:cupin domain-containing protein [Mycobacterium sp. DBP42]|jgi:gentisate 1,2-dioxygenase|uniref:cupin domain-containing protein n=1 Tax=Mycobacterium sp. DBP42 TaxID=2545267 RepID=UPI00110CFA02|nr:cupin domain-containing protein [Mycobacterium sp. DBP42]TMS52454.1 cupin domain-containing protein [Mycobacterium sp. DBP42]
MTVHDEKVDSGADDRYEELAELHAAPLWLYHTNLVPPEPRPTAVPAIWRYAELRPHLMHFLGALSLEDAERRVLMLVNPGMTDPPATTTSLYAGLQIIGPGETAQAHRHVANAFRYIMEGAGAYTTVNGERVHMSPGDLLLTPNWHWHDHHHEGDNPMVWLDALDYPLTNTLDASFFEFYGDRTQKSSVPDDLSSRQYIHGQLAPAWETVRSPASPIGKYPWTETLKAFEAIADDAWGSAAEGVLLEYRNPQTGGSVLPTMSCRISRLRPGFHGESIRRTASAIYHVVQGSGVAHVGETVLEWHDKDIFAVPPWHQLQLRNSSQTEDAYLFSYTNEPVLKALGFYREESTEDSSPSTN